MTIYPGVMRQPRVPTCWEFFGFDGPTNKHNLLVAYQGRRRLIGGEEWSTVVAKNYEECVRQLQLAETA